MTPEELAESLLVALFRRYLQDFDWRAARLGSPVHTLARYSLALNLTVGDDDWRRVTAAN